MMQLEPGVRAALDKMQALGKQDDNEHLAILRGGEIVEVVDGDSDHVELRDVINRNGFELHDIIVHNHPNSFNSLSQTDLMLARSVDAQCIYAISQDGSIYRGAIAPWVASPSLLGLFIGVVRRQMAPKYERVGMHWGEFAESSYLGAAHWANLKMREMGVISYEFELADESARLIAEMDEKLGKSR